ncbi:MAG: TonB-dependent receptor plug domain-containing protein [Treponema sp.]|nr:TonB-dependent receptor plug domain-containing protein [Treponema sp.]
MIKKSIGMLAISLLFLPLFSQEGGDEEDVILVSASKIDEELSRTTENVQVITRQMLEQSGSHTLSDALNSVPGVSFIGKTVGNSEPLQMNGFTDEYVKILVDGGAGFHRGQLCHIFLSFCG